MLEDFIVRNWFDLLQSTFIVGSFLLSQHTIRSEAQSRKVEHLLQINQNYREIWAKTYTDPKLLRIRERDIDFARHPITETEKRMVKEIIMHIFAVTQAIQNNQIDKGEMETDIYDFLRLPIPNATWKDVKKYYGKDFVCYIDNLIESNGS